MTDIEKATDAHFSEPPLTYISFIQRSVPHLKFYHMRKSGYDDCVQLGVDANQRAQVIILLGCWFGADHFTPQQFGENIVKSYKLPSLQGVVCDFNPFSYCWQGTSSFGEKIVIGQAGNWMVVYAPSKNQPDFN